MDQASFRSCSTHGAGYSDRMDIKIQPIFSSSFIVKLQNHSLWQDKPASQAPSAGTQFPFKLEESELVAKSHALAVNPCDAMLQHQSVPFIPYLSSWPGVLPARRGRWIYRCRQVRRRCVIEANWSNFARVGILHRTMRYE
ncbi:hypothetical protein V1525DRAFT_186248 [Lipomyces kononenkoae]|uniref:Uncharacterized protein n=1 Tax=Lipomyces kononenkoae TaxID=34357 RepID=A0ACC3SZB9_LIPKO